MVGDSPQSESRRVLDGDCGIQKQWPELLKNSQRMQIVDVLRFGSEVSHLLSELDFRLFKLLEGVLECFHKVTDLFINSSKPNILQTIRIRNTLSI
jgi:hypothetical protein